MRRGKVLYDVKTSPKTHLEKAKGGKMMKLHLSVKPDKRAKMIADKVTKVAGAAGHELVSGPEDADIIVAVGGDGSLFHTVHRYLHLSKTFIGVNGGTLGYRCAVDKHEVEEFAKHLMREPLPLSVFEVTYGDRTEYAVQDLRVERPTHRALRLKIEVNGEIVSYIHLADGILIANALGSTGYNRSAGGYELPLSEDGAIITPICAFPHPHYDSITGPMEMTGEVRITPTTDARLVLDDRPFELLAGETVTVRQITGAYRLIVREDQ